VRQAVEAGITCIETSKFPAGQRLSHWEEIPAGLETAGRHAFRRPDAPRRHHPHAGEVRCAGRARGLRCCAVTPTGATGLRLVTGPPTPMTHLRPSGRGRARITLRAPEACQEEPGLCHETTARVSWRASASGHLAPVLGRGLARQRDAGGA
jgi:hypothetical protein